MIDLTNLFMQKHGKLENFGWIHTCVFYQNNSTPTLLAEEGFYFMLSSAYMDDWLI